jgi:electron transfer flavoprotein alpha subunit
MARIVAVLQGAPSGGALPKSALTVIDAARRLRAVWGKDGIVCLCLGPGAEAAATEAAAYGFEEVCWSEDAELARYLAPVYADVVVSVVQARGADTVIGVASSTGKDLFPRVAAMLEAGQASDVVAVNDDGTLRRPMYAGDVVADVEIVTDMKVVTIRASAFEAAKPGGPSANLTKVEVSNTSGLGEVIGYERAESARPELGDAPVVVSGGVSLKSAENFERYLYPLADLLGAAVGASRAAVDAGYAPNDWQVGQTGKVVAPGLYIAVGISGAIQHLAGMKDSKCIVAINKDAEAPIFEVADYGLVGDLFETVPKLVDEIRRVKGG